jgi:hypothetical protein
MRNAVAKGCTPRNPVAAIKPREVVKPPYAAQVPGHRPERIVDAVKVHRQLPGRGAHTPRVSVQDADVRSGI